MGRKIDEQSTTELSWEDPPSGAPYNWPAIAEQLKAHPMTWARVDDKVRIAIINAVRQGSVRALHPDLGFEVRTTNNVREPQRMASLYLRWNPDKAKGK